MIRLNVMQMGFGAAKGRLQVTEEVELFKKKISKEEKLYIEAVKLQEAVSCVLRFEQKVVSLKSAARKFESLGEYKDSQARMKECRAQAALIREEGLKETFSLAMDKKERAKTKSDYADVITEFKRVVKREEYRDKAKEQIQFCKQAIAKMETRAAWKRRIITLLVLVVCIVAAGVGLDMFGVIDLSELLKGIR